jgi:hypothetical protein
MAEYLGKARRREETKTGGLSASAEAPGNALS